jgi:hypothetical protein
MNVSLDISSSHSVPISLDQSTANSMIEAGLHFAAGDHVNLDVLGIVGANGTHVSTSLQALQKLGIDSLGHDVNSLGIETLSISGVESLSDLNQLTTSLKDAGVDNLGLHSSELFANGSNLLSAFENNDWIKNGVNVTLDIDPINTAGGAQPNQNLDQMLVKNGVSLLTGTNLSANETMGSLIKTLHDSGLGAIHIEPTAKVVVGDELASALHDAGMLQALPESKLVLDAGQHALLNTSLKAMADMGVGEVDANADVFVKLGVTAQELSNMPDLYTALGIDPNAPSMANIFKFSGNAAVTHQASLVMDADTAAALGISGPTQGPTSNTSSSVAQTGSTTNIKPYNDTNVKALVEEMSKLGFTKVDVVSANKQVQEYTIDSNKMTISTPVTVAPSSTTATLLGTHYDEIHDPLFGQHH